MSARGSEGESFSSGAGRPMTVREKTGRRRYILFTLEKSGEIPQETMISVLNRRIRERGLDRRKIRSRLIFFGTGFGIVRCSHIYKEKMIEILNGIGIDGSQVRTIRTSGTLKTLRDWLRERKGVLVPGKRIKNKSNPSLQKNPGDTSIK